MMKALKKRLIKRHIEKQVMLASVIALSGAAVLVLYHLLFRARGVVAEIYHKAKLAKRIDLTSALEEYFSIPELPNVIFHVFGDGSIAFDHSDCPDQICVKTGKLRRPGQIAACLVNDVYVRILPQGDDIAEETDEAFFDRAQMTEAAEISGITSTPEDMLIPEGAETPEDVEYQSKEAE